MSATIQKSSCKRKIPERGPCQVIHRVMHRLSHDGARICARRWIRKRALVEILRRFGATSIYFPSSSGTKVNGEKGKGSQYESPTSEWQQGPCEATKSGHGGSRRPATTSQDVAGSRMSPRGHPRLWARKNAQWQSGLASPPVAQRTAR